MYQRDAQQVGESHPDVAGIGIVAVDQCGQPTLFLQQVGQVVAETLQVIPELFLGKVFPGTAGYAHDARSLSQRLDLPGVLRIDGGIVYQPGHQVDLLNVGVQGQRPGQVDHVLGLAPGIGVAPQFQLVGAYQPMHAQHADVHTPVVPLACRDSSLPYGFHFFLG